MAFDGLRCKACGGNGFKREEIPPPLAPDCPREEWEAAGREIQSRLAAARRLREKLPASWRPKEA